VNVKLLASQINRRPRAKALQTNARAEIGQKKWIVLLIVLLSPLAGHLLRKILPGNPAIIEGISIVPVAVFGIWSLQQRRKLPMWIAGPLVIWAAVQFVYVIVGGIVADPRVAVSAFGLRILPLVLAQVAYVCIEDHRDLRKLLLVLGIMTPFMAGISVYVSIFGDMALPTILRPVSIIEEFGITTLKGYYYTSTGLFTTPTQLGYYGFSVFIITLALMFRPHEKSRILLYAYLVFGFIILYLSGRRIMTYNAIILLIFTLSFKRNRMTIITLGFLGILLLQWIDDNTALLTTNADKRLAYLIRPDNPEESLDETLATRVKKYGWDRTLAVLSETPFGSYLGKYGPEGRTFAGVKYSQTDFGSVIETGSNQLAAEMGIIGALSMPICMLYIIYQIFNRSKVTINRNTINVLNLAFALLLFVFLIKGGTFAAGYQVSAFFYWAIPGLCASLIYEIRPNTKPVANRLIGSRQIYQRVGRNGKL